MSYEWHRVNKVEENFCREISEVVYDHVLQHFGVYSVEELTEEQIEEIET